MCHICEPGSLLIAIEVDYFYHFYDNATDTYSDYVDYEIVCGSVRKPERNATGQYEYLNPETAT